MFWRPGSWVAPDGWLRLQEKRSSPARGTRFAQNRKACSPEGSGHSSNPNWYWQGRSVLNPQPSPLSNFHLNRKC
jgi:hypothetical protein